MKLCFLVLLALSSAGAANSGPRSDSAAEQLPDFVASLEIRQGTRFEWVGLFADGTVAYTFRMGEEPMTTKKKKLSAQETEFLIRVIEEAVEPGLVSDPEANLLVDPNRRRMSIEIARLPKGKVKLAFDDLAAFPLRLGRARGVLEDLLDRFVEGRVSEKKEKGWDGTSLKEGDLLRRRQDGRLFRIVRDDRMSPFLELEDEDRRLERIKVSRKEAPRVFEDPTPRPSPERER
jgi:hypothetical protein